MCVKGFLYAYGFIFVRTVLYIYGECCSEYAVLPLHNATIFVYSATYVYTVVFVCVQLYL